MELKMAVLAVLGFCILALLIAVGYGAVLMLSNYAEPTIEDVLVADLLNICRSKFTIYTVSQTEMTRKGFCCASSDLNNNGVIGNLEYCAKLCTSCVKDGKGARMICEQPIDYYTNYDLC
ncbi:MAG: hypothetical protein JW791_05315 [Nanoarchaeota archaeon]|nr:hypothetical protein [Nanoarchaeota archaeon]